MFGITERLKEIYKLKREKNQNITLILKRKEDEVLIRVNREKFLKKIETLEGYKGTKQIIETFESECVTFNLTEISAEI